MNNNSGAQLIITKRYLSQRTAKCNEVLLRKGDVYLGNEMIKRNSNEGNMKVIVPNENSFQRGPQFRPLLLKVTILIICKCDVVFSKRKSGNARK